MFDSLKKKLSGWLKKEKEEEVVGEPEEKIEEKPEEPKKEIQEDEKKAAKKEDKKSEEVEEKEIKEEQVEESPETQGEENLKEEMAEVKEEVEETPKEELEDELDPEKKGFFSKLKTKLTTSILTQEQFDELFPELEMTLLENNVALDVVDKIKEDLSKDLVNVSIKRGEVEKTILESLKSAIGGILKEGEDIRGEIKKSSEPYVVLFFGINGSGKTTSVAKLAHKLKGEGISCVLGAGDTFRAASIEQLETHASKLGVPIVKGDYGSDPASVAFDTIAYAKKNKIQAVLIDTAGRMYTKANLMKEMEKIVRVSKPNLKIFVGESITGNDAVSQAQTFNDSVGIDGIILTKADVDEKAGAILSVSYVTGKPILFLGVGQGYEDLEEFSKGRVLKGLGLE